MRVPPGVYRRLTPAMVFVFSALSFACDHVPANHILWARLLAPVSSYSSKTGDPVRAVVIQDVACGDDVVFPVGTRIGGRVRSVRKVGWGIRHETAALGLSFDRADLSTGIVAISTVLLDVENAREQVSKGVIQGIRSSNSPQGMITSRYKYLPALNPYPDAGLVLFKATFPIFPEPEIYLPAGTDLQLKFVEPTASLRTLPASAEGQDPAEEYELMRLARAAPPRSTTVLLADADVINIAFLGSREQIEQAFYAAGWNTTDVFNRHSFLRNFYAFLNNSGYPQAPMRPFLLDGKADDMNWQKSLNSYAKRDHLRIWQWSTDTPTGTETIWLSSATHDAGASISLKHHEFVHHITPDIDEERNKIVRDLRVAGCVEHVYVVPRQSVATFTQNATGDPVRTDGNLAVVQLKTCDPVIPEMPIASREEKFKAGNKAFRYFRRSILTLRSDVWRANVIYAAYDLGHMGFEALRQHHAAAAANRVSDPAAPLHSIQTFD